MSNIDFQKDVRLQVQQVEKALRESEAKWHSLVYNMPAIVLTTNIKGIIEFINTIPDGVDPETARGKNIFDYILPQYHRLVKATIEHVLRTGEVGTYECEAADYHGHVAWYSTRLGPIRRDDEIIGLTFITTDITGRKRAEQALEDKNIALKEILAQIEIEKKQIQDNILANIHNVVIPNLEKIRLKGNAHQYVDLVKRNLKDITSSFGRKIAGGSVRLTSREIEICNMVRNGLASKEIASLLVISPVTIERHRANIRKKLGISSKEINLTYFLRRI